MPHISQHKLDDKIFEQLFNNFSSTITDLNRRNTKQFLNTFFTRTEKIMFTKRFAAIVMTHEGHSSYRIAKTLNMSPSTIARITLLYEKGKYTLLLKCMKKESEILLKQLETITRAGLPEMGKGRWNRI